MADPLQGAYTGSANPLPSSQQGTPLLGSNNAAPPSQMVSLTAAQPVATGGGMIQLLPSSGGAGPASSPPSHSHMRTQSAFVPMHSPTHSFDAMGLGMTTTSRLHGSMGHNVSSNAALGSAGILATTPSASSLTSLTSPNSALPSILDTYSYPAQSDGYDVYSEIGSGAFSTVYRGVVKESGEEVAIKVIDLDLFNTNWDEIRREILIMSQLQHPNVVRLKTAFVDGQDLWIVMHFAEAGSAASIMKDLGASNGLKDEVAIATILKEVLQALAYFHKHGSIHRSVQRSAAQHCDASDCFPAELIAPAAFSKSSENLCNASCIQRHVAACMFEHVTHRRLSLSLSLSLFFLQ